MPRALWFSLMEPQNLLNGACSFAAIKLGERAKWSARKYPPRYASGLRSTSRPVYRLDSPGTQPSAMDYGVSRLIPKGAFLPWGGRAVKKHPKGWICLQLFGCRYRVRGE